MSGLNLETATVIIRRFKARWDLWSKGDPADVELWAEELTAVGITDTARAKAEYERFTTWWDVNGHGKPTLGEFCRLVRRGSGFQGSQRDSPSDAISAGDPKVGAILGRIRKNLGKLPADAPAKRLTPQERRDKIAEMARAAREKKAAEDEVLDVNMDSIPF